MVVSRLTEQGRAKIEAKHAAWKGRWDEALAGLDIDELRAATLVLERLGTMVEDVPAQAGCEAPAQAPAGPARAAQN